MSVGTKTAKHLRVSEGGTDKMGVFRERASFVIGFLACALLCCVIELHLNAPLPALLVYCAMLIALFVRYPHFLVKYWLVIFLVSSNILGVFVVETSTMSLPELGVKSSYVGSFSPLVLCHTIFLSVLFSVDGALQRDSSSGSSEEKVVFALKVATVFAIIPFVLAATHPFFANQGIDRFEYKTLGLAQAIASRSIVLFIYLAPLAAMGVRHGHERLSLTFMLVCALTAFLTGNKFGFFMQVAYVLTLGLYTLVCSRFDKGQVILVLLMLLGSLMLLVGLVMVHNHIAYGTGFESNVSYLRQRMAQQGQLWWRTYKLEHAVGAQDHLPELQGEVAAWFNSEKDPASGTYGIYKIMLYDVKEPQLFYRKVADGSQYAYSTQASLYYYFGLVGVLVFSVVSAVVYCALVNTSILTFDRSRILQSVILVRLLNLSQGLLTQSVFDELFSYKVIAYIAMAVALTWFDEERLWTALRSRVGTR